MLRSPRWLKQPSVVARVVDDLLKLVSVVGRQQPGDGDEQALVPEDVVFLICEWWRTNSEPTSAAL